MYEITKDTILDLVSIKRGGLLSFGVLAALFLSTNGFNTLIKTFNQYTYESIQVILATELIPKLFSGNYFEINQESELLEFESNSKKIPFFISNKFLGKDLLDIKYEQLLKYALPAENPENAFRIIHGDYVTTSDGTGIVHTAPTFGADDALVAKQAKPQIPPMLVKDKNGD